jgi:hypothetical protein
VGQHLLRNLQIHIGGRVVTVVNVTYNFKDEAVELCAGREVSSLARAGRGATRARRRRGGTLILFFAMAMAGRIGGAQWRSAPPLAGSYGVDVDSTRLGRFRSLSHVTVEIEPR